MKWQVMEWGDDAIRLYERWGGHRYADSWLIYSFDKECLRKFCDVASGFPSYRIREAVKSDVPTILKYITVSVSMAGLSRG